MGRRKAGAQWAVCIVGLVFPSAGCQLNVNKIDLRICRERFQTRNAWVAIVNGAFPNRPSKQKLKSWRPPRHICEEQQLASHRWIWQVIAVKLLKCIRSSCVQCRHFEQQKKMGFSSRVCSSGLSVRQLAERGSFFFFFRPSTVQMLKSKHWRLNTRSCERPYNLLSVAFFDLAEFNVSVAHCENVQAMKARSRFGAWVCVRVLDF